MVDSVNRYSVIFNDGDYESLVCNCFFLNGFKQDHCRNCSQCEIMSNKVHNHQKYAIIDSIFIV